MLFNACSIVAGGPEPQTRKVAGLVRPRPLWSKGAPVPSPRVRGGTVATKEQFCFVLVDCILG